MGVQIDKAANCQQSTRQRNRPTFWRNAGHILRISNRRAINEKVDLGLVILRHRCIGDVGVGIRRRQGWRGSRPGRDAQRQLQTIRRKRRHLRMDGEGQRLGEPRIKRRRVGDIHPSRIGEVPFPNVGCILRVGVFQRGRGATLGRRPKQGRFGCEHVGDATHVPVRSE